MRFARFLNSPQQKTPESQGLLQKNVCKKLENGEPTGSAAGSSFRMHIKTKRALRFYGTPLFLREYYTSFSEFVKYFFKTFVHSLFTIHSKFFHSVLIPDSFLNFILQNAFEKEKLFQIVFLFDIFSVFLYYLNILFS